MFYQAKILRNSKYYPNIKESKLELAPIIPTYASTVKSPNIRYHSISPKLLYKHFKLLVIDQKKVNPTQLLSFL